ncbi:MAG: hypothetical protein WC071_09890 [Victivallaceae bacterium]
MNPANIAPTCKANNVNSRAWMEDQPAQASTTFAGLVNKPVCYPAGIIKLTAC